MTPDLPGDIPVAVTSVDELSARIEAAIRRRTVYPSALAQELGVSPGSSEFQAALDDLERRSVIERVGWRGRRLRSRIR